VAFVAATLTLMASMGMAQVQSDTQNLGTVNVGSAINFNEIETNVDAFQAYAGDVWKFTTAPSATGAAGEIVPLNLTLLGDPTWVSTVTGVELWKDPANFGNIADQLFNVLNPFATTQQFSFTFSPLAPNTTYNLIVKYSVGGGEQGGYIGSITAVPEPGALAMAVLGVGVVGFLTRRRQRVI